MLSHTAADAPCFQLLSYALTAAHNIPLETVLRRCSKETSSGLYHQRSNKDTISQTYAFIILVICFDNWNKITAIRVLLVPYIFQQIGICGEQVRETIRAIKLFQRNLSCTTMSMNYSNYFKDCLSKRRIPSINVSYQVNS